MEKYLSLIVLAAPGFIAERIATTLGVTSTKRGEFDSLARYLSYSFFAVIVAIFISALTGAVNHNGNWQDFTDKFSSKLARWKIGNAPFTSFLFEILLQSSTKGGDYFVPNRKKPNRRNIRS